MTLPVFPTLPGIGWSIDRQETWQTRQQQNISGKETRIADWSAPRHQWDLTFDLLRQGAIGQVSYAEMAQLQGFFNLAQGMFGTFIYQDVDDNAVTGQILGLGDGTTAAFPLVKTFGNSVEPVYALTGAPTVYKTDWQGTVAQYTTARTNEALQSGNMTVSPWQRVQVTMTQSGIAPDGVSVANFQTTTGNSGSTFLQQDNISAGSGQYTASVYFKVGANAPFCFLQMDDHAEANFARMIVNTSTFAVSLTQVGGSITIISATVVPIGGGWNRIIITFNMPSGVTLDLGLFGLCQDTLLNAPTVIGATGSWWGFQLETGSTATSYIPTTTAPVTVTDYTLTANSLGQNTVATFSTPPASGATITADAAYAYVCRFLDDTMTFSKFMATLYEAKKVSILSLK